MKKNLKNRLQSKKGFTLVELIVVIVIIAILAAALVTSLVGYINRARDANAQVEATNAYTAAQAYISETVGTEGLSALDGDTMVTEVNTYLGTTGATNAVTNGGTANAITACYCNNDGTITSFQYISSGEITVTFNTGAWEVGGGTPTTTDTEIIGVKTT